MTANDTVVVRFETSSPIPYVPDVRHIPTLGLMISPNLHDGKAYHSTIRSLGLGATNEIRRELQKRGVLADRGDVRRSHSTGWNSRVCGS